MLKKYSAHRPHAVAAAVATALSLSAPAPSIAQQAANDGAGLLEEVTVTGSRIVRRDYEASSPILTVGAEALDESSQTGIESALNQLPQFKPAGSQFVANQTESSAFNSVGIATLNLRGLGTNRSLVLVNGKRAQPANATLVVDVNTIPSAAIQNIEIISGGASSVYGADAIAGVVNFILKDNFEGVTADLQTGGTERGDGQESRASVLGGGKFASGRGRAMLGIDWTKRDKVLQSDRAFYRDGWADPGTPGASLRGSTFRPNNAANRPSQAALNSVFSDFPAGAANPANPVYFNPDRTVFQSSPAVGYNGPLDGTIKQLNNGSLSEVETQGLISSPLERYSAFGRLDYKVTDSVNGFLQANFSSITVDSVLLYSPAVTFWDATIPYDPNHPVPAELKSLLDSRPAMATNPNAPWHLERYLDFLGPRTSTNTSNVYQVMAGADGKLPVKDWTWEAYASQGRTDAVTFLKSGYASLARYRMLVTAPNYGKNFSLNANNGFIATCTSGIPVFDDFQISQDCIDAMSVPMKNYTDFKQRIAEVNFQGGLFDLPAGEVRSAVGLSYRENSVSFQPDPLLGVQSVLDQPIGLFAVSDTGGSADVKEAYTEFLVPLLKDLPAVKQLNLELGFRYSDYNTAGGQNTWKALADWKINNVISFRGGYQVANRAPNTAELFTGSTLNVAQFPVGDPCASNTLAPWGNVASNPNRAKVQELCSKIIGASGGSVYDINPSSYVGPFGFFTLEIENLSGNPNLKPEEGRTWTAGLVFRSPFEGALSNLTSSIDWYQITISGAISPISSLTTYEQCLNGNGSSNPNYDLNDPGGYCKLITRDRVSGDRLRVDAPYLNLGGIETSGVDVQVSWRAPFDELHLPSIPGALNANFVLNYLDSYKTQANPGAPFLEAAGTLAQNGQYEWRTFTQLGYSVAAVNVGLSWNHLPKTKDSSVVTVPTSTVQPVEAYDLFDLTASWRLNETVQVRAGVDNLFDADPKIVGRNPPNTNNATNTLPGYYDLLGRRYYLGLKASF
jgi:outer membrane receptor protein involved in Fe transport